MLQKPAPPSRKILFPDDKSLHGKIRPGNHIPQPEKNPENVCKLPNNQYYM